MPITVTAKGPTLDALTRDTLRDLRAGNRAAGRQIAKVGARAMNAGAPAMFGRTLKVKTDVDAWPDRCNVEFYPAPGSSAGWAIQESGRRGGYVVKPRRARALTIGGRFSTVARPGPTSGHKAWTRAGERLAAVLDRTVADVFDDAMGA